MAKDPVSQISNVNAGLDQTLKKLNAFESILKRIGGVATKSLDSVSRILMPSVGMGPGLNLGTNNAQFSNGAGGTPAGSSTNAMPWIYSKPGAAGVAGVQLGLGLAGAAYGAMPDLGMTVSRATGFYQSSLRTGGMMNRAGVAAATFSALGGGITGVGDDVAAAAMLSQGYNFMPGTSSFNRMMREVGGVGRYFGMQNATAAQAIGGLRTGRMGAQLYQYGINTTDPNTGQPVSTEAIAQQLFSRMTMGGRIKTSAEEMATNLRAGFGSVDMQMFSPEQRAILEPMLINMAAGKPLGDLATLPFNADNPLNAQMKLATSMTSLMERGTEPMIAGFESAANAAAALNAQLEKLPDGFFKTKGFVQGLSNTNAGTAISGVVSGIAGAAGTLLAAKGVRSAFAAAAARSGAAAMGGAAAAGGNTVVSGVTAATAARAGLSTAAKRIPILGGAISGATGQGFLSTVGIGAAAGGVGGALFGGVGAVPGAIAGGLLSGLGYLGGQALRNMFGTPANAAQTSQTGTAMTAGMDPELLQTLQNAGFSGTSLSTAYGIVKAESGGRPGAKNMQGLDKSYGLFQINMENNDPRNPNMGVKRNEAYLKKYKSIGYTGPESLLDPFINARIAYDISKGGTNFNPWTTYTSGKYLQHTSGTASASMGNKTVNITVNLANASAAEANRLAKQVKEILLKDKDLQEVGGK
jgi:hypothetical protein